MSGDINLNSVSQSRSVQAAQQSGSSQRRERIKNEFKPFPLTTETKVVQNRDGSFSEITVRKYGGAVNEQETKYTFDAEGNKIINSVRRREQPGYGLPTEKEYIDTDGDGFADQMVERMLCEPPQEKVTKFPPIKDVEGADRENRRMGLIDKGMVCG